METPEKLLIGSLCVLAALATAYGMPRMWAALRRPEEDGAPLLLIRGLRAFIVALAFAAIAFGRWTASNGFVLFGVFFLAEELYETGLILLILRWGKARGFV